MNIKLITLIAAGSGLLLVGCGNDGNSNSNPKVTGTITQINNNGNNVTVKGINFDASNAEIDSENSGDLTEGMVVVVDGSVDGNQGVANKITYDSEVEGVVTAIDVTAGTMSVMGQLVLLTMDTLYYNDVADAKELITEDAIMAGNVVEVSAMPDSNGDLVASRVVLKADFLADDEEIEIKGYVTNYDGINTFSINACQITTTDMTEYDNIDMLVNDMYVEVKSIGMYVSVDANTCSIEAMEIENEDEYDDGDNS